MHYRHGLQLALLMLLGFAVASRAASPAPAYDTALMLAVDVSDSVDEARYRLQMDGIAAALEDPAVIATITGGARGGILLAMTAWDDHPHLALPWTGVRSAGDAAKVAARIRALPRRTGQFTCMARMMRFLAEEIVPDVRGQAARVVVDVSGDGPDNCNPYPATSAARDALVAAGATVNGLPIIEGEDRIVGQGAFRAPGEPFRATLDEAIPRGGGEPMRLEPWYREHVVGGDAAFLIAAQGYDDFARAFRRKFVMEISSREPAARAGSPGYFRAFR
jgi:hypothetical protein